MRVLRKTIPLPASVGIAVLLACVAALLAALASASAASRDHGASFAVRCDFSHRKSDDPIVYPGEEGAAHSHDFFGNTWDQAELKRLVTRCINNVPPSEPRPEERRAPTATA